MIGGIIGYPCFRLRGAFFSLVSGHDPAGFQFVALEVRYGGYLALSDVWLEVGRCEVACLLGANGSGKSSLLSPGERPARTGRPERRAAR